MAIDYTSAIGQVRLLLGDVDESRLVFTDPQVQAFLDLEDQNVKLAAAQAIDVNATDQALASKVLRTQDLSTDGSKVATAMRAQASSLRQQAYDHDEGAFEIIEMPQDPHLTPSFPERNWWW